MILRSCKSSGKTSTQNKGNCAQETEQKIKLKKKLPIYLSIIASQQFSAHSLKSPESLFPYKGAQIRTIQLHILNRQVKQLNVQCLSTIKVPTQLIYIFMARTIPSLKTRICNNLIKRYGQPALFVDSKMLEIGRAGVTA